MLTILAAAALQAPGTQPDASPAMTQPDLALATAKKPEKERRLFGRVGVVRALYNSGAIIALDHIAIPGSTAGVTDSTTVTFDVGYNLTDSLAVMLMTGFPPRASVLGQGSVAPFGRLGSVRFGPVVLTAIYRLPEWHRFRAYVGGGGERLFILKTFDGAVSQLRVQNSWGSAVQAGVEYRLSRGLTLFADYKHLWLHVSAEGLLAGYPVTARVKLNPDLISTGIKFRF